MTRISKKVITSNNFILGDEVKSFENKFSKYTKINNCVSVGNGTDALYLSLLSLNLSPNSKIMLQSNAGGYGYNAIRRLNHKAVFIDCDISNGQISLESIKKKYSNNVKAIIVTHLYGCINQNILDIQKFCLNNNVFLIEDCAQAAGSFFLNKHSGSWGHLATFSFYPTKNLNCLGDGGAILTSRKYLHSRLIKLRNYGWKKKYDINLDLGINSRLDEFQAAFLNYKLKFLNSENSKRRKIIKFYRKNINNKKVKHLEINIDKSWNAHLYICLTKNRKKMINYLKLNKIFSNSYYPYPDYKTTLLKKKFKNLRLLNSEFICSCNFSLPTNPNLSISNLRYIVNIVNNY